MSLLVLARGFRQTRLRRACSPRSAAAARTCARRSCSTTTGTRFLADGDARQRRASWPSARPRCSSTTRSTSSTPRARPGFPKGATLSHHNILNNALLRRRAAAATPSATASACRCRSTTASAWCSATSRCATHGACMVVPGESFDPLAVLRDGRRPSAARRSTACRRCSSPSSTTRASTSFDLSSLRTGIMAGAPVPGRGDEAGAVARCTWTRSTIVLRHDRDLAGLDADRARRPARQAGRAPSAASHPHVEIKIVDPTTGAIVPRGTPGELCTRGYSVMLGYWNDAEATARGDRRRRLDAHRRPRGDGRRRLRAASSAGSRT